MGGKNSGMSEATTLTTGQVLEDSGDALAPAASDSQTPQESVFDIALRDALTADKIADARTLVANAEAVLMAHGTVDSKQTEQLTPAQLAVAKARIAIATGDGPAARAILVQAIENNPKVAALRTLMTEVMLADGRATDVRPVLQHLGKSVRGRPGHNENSGERRSNATIRDTSG